MVRIIPPRIYTLAYMAFAYQRRGNYALAETYAEQALAGRRRAGGEEHRESMASAAVLALAYVSQGKFAQSEPLAREALDIDQRKTPG